MRIFDSAVGRSLVLVQAFTSTALRLFHLELFISVY